MTTTVPSFWCKEVADLATTIKEDHSLISKNVHKALVWVLSEDMIDTHGKEFSDFLISRFEWGNYDAEQAQRVSWIWNVVKLKEDKLHELFDDVFEAHKKNLLKWIKSYAGSQKDDDSIKQYWEQMHQAKAFEDSLKGNNYAGLKQIIDDLIAGKTIQECLLGESQEETTVELEFDETITNIEYSYSQERTAQRAKEPEFEEQYAFNDKLFDSGKLSEWVYWRIYFNKIGKYMEWFNGHQQAVVDVFKDIEWAVWTYSYKHSSGRKITHQEVYYKPFKKYIDDNGWLEWNSSKQLTKSEIMDEYCSIYPNEWTEKQKHTALEDACPQLFGVRHVIDEIPQVLWLERNESSRVFHQRFSQYHSYGLVLGWNA